MVLNGKGAHHHRIHYSTMYRRKWAWQSILIMYHLTFALLPLFNIKFDTKRIWNFAIGSSMTICFGYHKKYHWVTHTHTHKHSNSYLKWIFAIFIDFSCPEIFRRIYLKTHLTFVPVCRIWDGGGWAISLCIGVRVILTFSIQKFVLIIIYFLTHTSDTRKKKRMTRNKMNNKARRRLLCILYVYPGELRLTRSIVCAIQCRKYIYGRKKKWNLSITRPEHTKYIDDTHTIQWKI